MKPTAEGILSEPVLLERRGPIAVVRLNRPEKLNALSDDLLARLILVLGELDRDYSVGAIVVVGSDHVFSVGADIAELSAADAREWVHSDPFERWSAIRRVRVPIIAAVSGLALGGGCELALLSDVVIANMDAVFGLPEVGIGLLPGAGGTQRLTASAGKAVAMDVVLTGRRLTALEAQSAGIVSRVVDGDPLLLALELAAEISRRPRTAVRLAKGAVLTAFEGHLEASLAGERLAFLVALEQPDAREGIEAFLEKRQPRFQSRDAGSGDRVNKEVTE